MFCFVLEVKKLQPLPFTLSVFITVQNSPIPTSLPEPLTASEVAAKKSTTKARYLNYFPFFS